MKQSLDLPSISTSKITEDLVKKVDALSRSLAAEDIVACEIEIDATFGIHPKTQKRYKTALRKMFEIPLRTSLAELSTHPQIRQALEVILLRKERNDEGALRSAKGLSVVMPTNGEIVSVEEFLKSLYPREAVNAASCYRALKARCFKKQVIKEDGSPCAMIDLPGEASISRFLKKWRVEFVAVRRGRSRKNDWQKFQEGFVTRDVSQYRAGELWIGDHTELDFMVINENGKPDRRWITAYIDIRTGLLVGYHLSWQPNSNTIALAFRNGVLGTQLKACVESEDGLHYSPVQVNSVPEVVMLDNGKDYRSKYTQRVMGKIDFDDSARLSIQRITRLHYTAPYHGQSKAQMERWFGTIQQMVKYLPGYKGNKYQNTPDSLKAETKQGKLLHVEQFDMMIAIAINTYNNRIRRSLKEQSPLQCYLTNQTVQRTIDPRVLDFLMLKAENKVIRRCQFTLFGQEYYSDSLLAFNGKHADIYYDPNDLGFVAIYVEKEFAAVACNKEMIGRDESGWKRILRDRQRNEHGLQTELKDYRRGISNTDAKIMLLEGELLNAAPVSADLLAKTAPSMTVLTGLEKEAKHQVEQIDRQKEVAVLELETKKKSKQTPLRVGSMENIR